MKAVAAPAPGLRANTAPQHNRRMPILKENQAPRGLRSWLAPMILAVCGMVASAIPAGADASDIPAGGRSLFDIMTTVVSEDASGESARLEVPFPFERLRALIKKAGGLSDADIAETLIPLGRSLQRRAAAPDYFASPRRVLGVIAEPPEADPATTLVLKDRLFIGHQPRTESLEVISFNEAAGRFEFQIVEDYAPGKVPRVRQARRALCLGCHGNGGPIFPEAPWSETPAHPAIAARLAKVAGAPPPDPATIESNRRSAAALYRSVGAANRLSHAARYWRIACTDPATRQSCRSKLLKSISIPTGHDPTSDDHGKTGQDRADIEETIAAAQARAWPEGFTIASPFIADINPLATLDAKARDLADPLNERPALAVLDATKAEDVDRIIALLRDAFTARHVAWLRDVLREREPVQAASPAALGPPPANWCCAPHDKLPPPVGAAPRTVPLVPGLSIEPGPAHPSLQAFHRACGACHSSMSSMPPNFLHGTSIRQLRAITECAPRISLRLSQWRARDGDASTAMPPMPPPRHLAALGQTPENWLASADFRRISRFAAALAAPADVPLDGIKTNKPVCAPLAK